MYQRGRHTAQASRTALPGGQSDLPSNLILTPCYVFRFLAAFNFDGWHEANMYRLPVEQTYTVSWHKAGRKEDEPVYEQRSRISETSYISYGNQIRGPYSGTGHRR